MPSNRDNLVDYYVQSTVATTQREVEELRKLILEEQGNTQSFIKALEDYGRSIQDDMQRWVQIGGEADRAERRLLLDRAKAQAQADRRARRASSRASGVVGAAFDKTVERAAKATAGAGAEAGLSLARIIEKATQEGGPSPAQYLARQLQSQGKFASALVSGEGFGAAAGGEDDEAKTAYSVGMLRALKEANRGLVSDAVLKEAISLITGVPAAVINEQTLSTMKTARTQQIETRSRGAGARAGDVISDELMKDGFALDDFLPAMQAQNLIIREQDTLRQIEQARQQRITDTEAEVERRMLERVDTGRGLEFAPRGVVGAIQYRRQVAQQRGDLERYRQQVQQVVSENESQQQYLASLSPNVRLLHQATGQGMASYQKHGNNIPPGVNNDLWSIGGQLTTMKQANGFRDAEDLVVKARAMVNQLEGAGDMTPQQRENMLSQALEFYTMQATGDFPPPPTDQPVLTPEEQQEAIADPDAARGIQESKANEEKPPEEEPSAPEEEVLAAISTQGREGQPLGLSKNDLRVIRRMVDSISDQEDINRPGRPIELGQLEDRLEQLQQNVSERVSTLRSRGLVGVGKKIAGISERNAPIRGEDPGLLASESPFALAISNIKKARMQLLLLDMLKDAGPIQDGKPRTTLSLSQYLDNNPSEWRHVSGVQDSDLPGNTGKAMDSLRLAPPVEQEPVDSSINSGLDIARLEALGMSSPAGLQSPSSDILLQQLYEREEEQNLQSDISEADLKSDQQLLEAFGVGSL